MAYTNDDIYNYAKGMGYLDANGQVKDEAAGRALWTDAQKYGVSLNQLDSAFGWDSGTSQNWLTQRGLYTAPTTPSTPTAPVTTGGTSTNTATNTTTTQSPSAPASPTNVYNPTPAAGTTAQTNATNPADFTAMINSIVAGIRGTPVAAAPEKPAAFVMTPEMLAGISAQDRIGGLLSGPTAQQASREALALANQRGLLNSSMAVEGANEAMIRNAADIAAGDANRYGSLLATGINRDLALDQLFARAGFDERMQGLDANSRLASDAANFALKDAASVRDSNADWQRQLQTFGLESARDNAITASTRAYNDSVRTQQWAREDQQQIDLWAREDATTSKGLQGLYGQQLLGLRDQMNAEIASTEGADLPADVKAARVQEVQQRYTVLLELTNSIFNVMPGWRNEWAQLELATEGA